MSRTQPPGRSVCAGEAGISWVSRLAQMSQFEGGPSGRFLGPRIARGLVLDETQTCLLQPCGDWTFPRVWQGPAPCAFFVLLEK